PLWQWRACPEYMSHGPRRSTRPRAFGVRHPVFRRGETSTRLPIAGGLFGEGCRRDERSHAASRRSSQNGASSRGYATWERHSPEWRSFPRQSWRHSNRQSGDWRSRVFPDCACSWPLNLFNDCSEARLYLRACLDFERSSGQRAKTEVVRPPRGVNSPRTTHHSGLTAATMSRSILLTAFS